MCEWKLFLTLNHGLQDSLGKRGECLWHSGRTLLGNTSSHWFSLRASSLDGGSAAQIFPEFALVSLLAGYHWFFNLTFTFLFFVVFCFTFLLLDAVLGDETPFVVTPCTKVKVALQNLVFLSFLSSRCMHYLWKKSSLTLRHYFNLIISDIFSLFQWDSVQDYLGKPVEAPVVLNR